MKSTKSKFYLRWGLIAFLITFACVAAGFYVVHILRELQADRRSEVHHERMRAKRIGPLEQRARIIKQLIERGMADPKEAFEIVDQANMAPFPEKTYLVTAGGKVISTHQSPSFGAEDFNAKLETYTFNITDDIRYRIEIAPTGERPPPPGPPGPPGSPGHQARPPGAPPGTIALAVLTVGVSLLIGVALSIMLLTLYLRRRARQVSKVMRKIKSGDLNARFEIGPADEAGKLMRNFNEMADEIEKLVEDLRETENARTILLQELAHDFRTPVASLKNLQETLFEKADRLTPEKKERLQQMAFGEVIYFERLVEDLLFLSGVNNPMYTKNFNQIRLAPLLEEETQIFKESGKTFQMELDAGAYVNGEIHLLRRMIKNVLSNATKFADSKVAVRLIRDKAKVMLEVENDGPNLNDADLENFGKKKFSRELGRDRNGYISIGLGSVIIKKIAHLHGAELKVKNTDTGVLLQFIFP